MKHITPISDIFEAKHFKFIVGMGYLYFFNRCDNHVKIGITQHRASVFDRLKEHNRQNMKELNKCIYNIHISESLVRPTYNEGLILSILRIAIPNLKSKMFRGNICKEEFDCDLNIILKIADSLDYPKTNTEYKTNMEVSCKTQQKRTVLSKFTWKG